MSKGHKTYVEVKGYFRAEDRQKMKHVLRCNPDLDIRMVFAVHRERDIKWCLKHNVPYAINCIPKAWFK